MVFIYQEISPLEISIFGYPQIIKVDHVGIETYGDERGPPMT